MCAEMIAAKPHLTASITVKVSPAMKRAMQKKAFDDDATVCQLIRRALLTVYPDLRDAKN